MRTLIRVTGASLAALILLSALSLPWFRNPEGELSGRFALAISASIASLLLAFAARTSWMRAAGWTALALTGQAAALQLIWAGIRVHYQHYYLPQSVWGQPFYTAVMAFLCFQAALVAVGIGFRFASIRSWLKGRLSWLQIAGTLSLLCLTGATVSRGAGEFAAELCLAAIIQLVNVGNILLVAATLTEEGASRVWRKLDSILRGTEKDGSNQAAPRLDRFAIVTALLVTCVSGSLAYFVYQGHPHLEDEVAYLYNARYLAAAKLTMAAPPVQAAFDLPQMEYEATRWYSSVTFGWPATLALGALVGAPWLVNPVLAGINVLLAYLLLSELYSRRIARIAIALLAVSPWYVFLGMSFMTHMVTTACAIGGFVALAACRRTGKARWAFVAGAAAGLGSLIRPLDGAIVACLLGLMAIGLGARRLKFSSLVALGLGTVLAASLIFPYNQALTGDPMNSPLVAYRDKHFAPKSNAYGFGPERGLNWAMDPWPGHTPFEALINVEVNASTLNADLFGWSTGSLLLIGVIVLSGGLKRRDYHMLFVIAAVLLAYAPYWFAGGPDYGPRYWFLILIPCVALTARGLEWLETRLSTSGGIGNPRVGVAVAVLALLTVVNYFPWRSLDKYRHYLRMRPDVRAIAAQKQMGRSLVLVRGDQFPDYTSAAIYNPLDLNSGQPVYAWDRDATTRAELLRTYSDRPVWIVEGPTITKAGYRVIAGPLKAADLATGALHLEQASAVR